MAKQNINYYILYELRRLHTMSLHLRPYTVINITPITRMRDIF